MKTTKEYFVKLSPDKKILYKYMKASSPMRGRDDREKYRGRLVHVVRLSIIGRLIPSSRPICAAFDW
jgi:hypothetical protein